MKLINYFILVLSGTILAACALQQEKKASDFHPVSYQNLTGWDKENFPQILTLFQQNCHYIQRLPANDALGGPVHLVGGKVSDWAAVCHAADWVDNRQPAAIKRFFEQWLQPYQYSAVMKEGKVTGYYEPEIEGSLVKNAVYHVPVYGRPKDLLVRKINNNQVQYGRTYNNRFYPYYSRAEINQGALEGRNLEIAWLKNPEDLFFMQIQGSGRILLPDGKVMRLAYDGKNGQPYTPIGKLLIDRGDMDPASVNIYSIRFWLQKHSDKAVALMNENRNYVFFKLLENQLNEGPKGAFGIPLNAGRSVAVDKNWTALGIPLWLETTVPVDSKQTRHGWQHMVFSHDLGGDIQGVNRIDLFTGWGKNAEWYAGLMHEKGRLFFLLPRFVSQQSSQSVK